LTAPFFAERFSAMQWSILTPARSAHWTGETVVFGPGASKAQAPTQDALEAVWRTYYASIFNPARLKPAAMLREMPKKYWANLPEAPLIGALTRSAGARETEMVATPAARAHPRAATILKRRKVDEAPPPRNSLEAVREEASHCERCPLYRNATQTVFGEGAMRARLVFVGEQPGDQEDLAGKPFVGPAGQLFDRALAEAGIARKDAYVTNAVKHFKYEPRGKRRIHQKPTAGEIDVCRWWLDQELALVKPHLAVALGATAARGLVGKNVPVMASRGKVLPGHAVEKVFVTVHPSFLLRLPDEESRAREWAAFVRDLVKVRRLMEAP
jgi:DNA polymerase